MLKRLIAPSVLIALLAGCGLQGDGSGTANLTDAPTFESAAARPQADSEFVPPQPESGVFQICKVGTAAEFLVKITVNPPDGPQQTIEKTVSLDDGECEVIHTESGGAMADYVTVTEIVPEGYKLDTVWVIILDEFGNITTRREPGPSIEGGLDKDSEGILAVFYNSPLGFDPGRMTGGGFQVRVDGVRVTRGLTLHCDITLSNNLEINWANANNWHITRPLLSAECIDDPQYDPFPPVAPFDTFIGEAMGKLNGEEGSICRFKFIDNGEPGNTDEAYIDIWEPGADPDVDTPYMSVGGVLDGGNLQAHYDQPHGQ